MPVLNHHIVSARDSEHTAAYIGELLGLPSPIKLGEFAVLRVSEHTTLDFIDSGGDFELQHYAFLVTEEEFDVIFGRIKERDMPFWADPFHKEPNEINHWDDGRGVYFDDPNGHRLEIITRPYGSGGTECAHPHPLVAPRIDVQEKA